MTRLEAAVTFPWRDPLDAVHEENLFQSDSELLGDESAALWVRFDKEMDRLRDSALRREVKGRSGNYSAPKLFSDSHFPWLNLPLRRTAS